MPNEGYKSGEMTQGITGFDMLTRAYGMAVTAYYDRFLPTLREIGAKREASTN